ncbi:hypothetical protein Aduo_016789 [Ancylostoma duodenale]
MSRTWNLGLLLTDWGGPRRRRAARGDETAISRLSPAEPNGKLPKSHRTAQHNDAHAHSLCRSPQQIHMIWHGIGSAKAGPKCQRRPNPEGHLTLACDIPDRWTGDRGRLVSHFSPGNHLVAAQMGIRAKQLAKMP